MVNEENKSEKKPTTEHIGKVPVFEYRRVVYLIPNLFTATAFLAGYYSIIKAIEGDYVLAAWAIVFASVMDSLDGRIARLINAKSAFGAQFDSLSDAMCFGVAPMVLAHQWGLLEFGYFGFTVEFFFGAAAIIRLARFNIAQSYADQNYFSGLPSPIAGISVASLILVFGNDPRLGEVLVLFCLIIILATTMVSDFRYYSFKDINLRSKVNSPAMLLLALAVFAFFSLVFLEFQEYAIFVACLLYLISGFVISSKYLIKRIRTFFKSYSSKDMINSIKKDMVSNREKSKNEAENKEKSKKDTK